MTDQTRRDGPRYPGDPTASRPGEGVTDPTDGGGASSGMEERRLVQDDVLPDEPDAMTGTADTAQDKEQAPPLLREGSDALDAADIEDPANQI
jgi:hypothetical protein